MHSEVIVENEQGWTGTRWAASSWVEFGVTLLELATGLHYYNTVVPLLHGQILGCALFTNHEARYRPRE